MSGSRLPRKKITTARGGLKKYDGWLDQAGVYLAHILDGKDQAP
ncbi:hypothetical protein [Myceligenerans salitolerans]|nr:hypothetical protein [Myceligenerans salitolerans]